MWFGDKVMVNGAVWPFFEVRQGKYREHGRHHEGEEIPMRPPDHRVKC